MTLAFLSPAMQGSMPIQARARDLPLNARLTWAFAEVRQLQPGWRPFSYQASQLEFGLAFWVALKAGGAGKTAQRGVLEAASEGGPAPTSLTTTTRGQCTQKSPNLRRRWGPPKSPPAYRHRMGRGSGPAGTPRRSAHLRKYPPPVCGYPVNSGHCLAFNPTYPSPQMTGRSRRHCPLRRHGTGIRHQRSDLQTPVFERAAMFSAPLFSR